MASRKLIVEVVGDASSLERSLKRASRSANTFGRDITRTGRATEKLRSQMGVASGSFAVTTTAAVALGAAVRASFQELFAAQKVTAQTEAALRSTGYAAGVTAEDIDKLGTSLLQLSGVDDELIKSSANLLLTFTRVRNEAGAGNDIFNQATAAALDMSVAMGTDLQSAALRLGKALNDPVRGITALRRVGVQFTDAQQAQIAALVKTGDTLEAQKIILRELQTEFGGSAKAAGDTLPGQLNKARESARNLGATVASITAPAFVAFAESANELLTAIQNLNDPRQGLPGLGEFFRGLGTRLPAGTEALPTIGPFLGALRGAFRDAGEKSGETFVEGFADAVASSPRAEAAAARAAAAFGAAIDEKKRKPFGAGTPFLDLGQAEAERSKALWDDLALAVRRLAVLRERLSKATGLKEKTDLQNAINAERDRADAIRDQIREKKRLNKEAADEAFREAARRRAQARLAAQGRRETRLFGVLGRGPGGAELVPNVASLRKTFDQLRRQIRGTLADTPENRRVFGQIGKVFLAGLKDSDRAVRQWIDDFFDQFEEQLDRRKRSFRVQTTAMLTAGLGLTREQREILRGRLAGRARGGTVADRGLSAFGVGLGQPRGGRGPQAVRDRPINVTLLMDKKVVASIVVSELQRQSRSRARSSRGRYGGVNTGLA